MLSKEAGKIQNILLSLLELQLLLSFKSLIRTVMRIMNIIFIMSKWQKTFSPNCYRNKKMTSKTLLSWLNEYSGGPFWILIEGPAHILKLGRTKEILTRDEITRMFVFVRLRRFQKKLFVFVHPWYWSNQLDEFQFCNIDIPKLISSNNDTMTQFTENKFLKNNFIPFPFYTFLQHF